MTAIASPRERGSVLPAIFVIGSLGILVARVAVGRAETAAGAVLVLVSACAMTRTRQVDWAKLIAALIMIILLIPIRRYQLPGNLPFNLEPYRIYVALLLLGWFASLLADPRTVFRRTGFEGPLALI